MPLITLCGWPCCGKTSFANGLITFLQSSQDKPVVLVNEETLHIRKAEGYQDATAEKQMRGSLKAGVDHALNSRTIVVLDSMNYIKGFRYELYCSAKSESTPSCVVWVEAEAEDTKEWNGERDDAYPPELLDDLRSRFEVPDDRNRWDKPLVRCPATVGVDDSAREEVYRSVLDAITGGQQVVAGMATQPSQHAEADVLYQLDTVTNKIVSTMMDRQSTAVGHGLTVQLPGATKLLELTRKVGLPEAKRLKRQFIKQVAGLGSGVASGAAEPSEREKAITDAFVEYLNVNIS